MISKTVYCQRTCCLTGQILTIILIKIICDCENKLLFIIIIS